MGASENGRLLSLLQPKVVVPLLNAEFEQSGPLADLLQASSPEPLPPA